MRNISLIAVAITAVMACQSDGQAQSTRYTQDIPTHLGHRTCFDRTYDQTHLANHPEQKVKWMRLELVRNYSAAEFESGFSMQIAVRGSSKLWSTGGYVNGTIVDRVPRQHVKLIAMGEVAMLSYEAMAELYSAWIVATRALVSQLAAASLKIHIY